MGKIWYPNSCTGFFTLKNIGTSLFCKAKQARGVCGGYKKDNDSGEGKDEGQQVLTG